MNERDFGLEVLDCCLDFPLGAVRIHRARDECCLLPQRVALDLVIVPGETQDLVPIALEEVSFRYCRRVLSPELLVEVVNKENLH